MVPTQQSVNLAAKLTPVLEQEKITIDLLGDAKHGGPQSETKENIELVLRFLDDVLK